MRIIDFHTHIYPQKVAQKATDSISKFYELEGGGMCGTAEQLIERGDIAGISEFVVLPVAIKPDHVRSINNFIIEQVAENSRFYGFGTVHADMENICEEFEYIKDNGLLGIKMHPDTQLFNIDDERLFPLYAMAEETAYKYLKDTKCYFDISSSLMFMKQGEAENYINAYGAERMLYGTDFPLWDPIVEVKRFLELQLNASQFDKISHQNALRILKK